MAALRLFSRREGLCITQRRFSRTRLWCKPHAAAGQESVKGWRKTSPPAASHSNMFSGGRVSAEQAGGGGAGSAACVLPHPAGRGRPCPRPPSAASSRGNACGEPQALRTKGLRARAAHGRRRRKWDKDQCRACIAAPSGNVGGEVAASSTPHGGVKPQVPRRPLQVAGFSDSNKLQKARVTRGGHRAGALLLWSQLSKLGVFSPERRRLRGHLRAAFSA